MHKTIFTYMQEVSYWEKVLEIDKKNQLDSKLQQYTGD